MQPKVSTMAKTEIKISNLSKLTSNISDADLLAIVSNNKTYNVSVGTLLQEVNDTLDLKENYLGMPIFNNAVLSSDIQGNRSWVLSGDAGVLGGGLPNQIIVKQTTTEGDAEWADQVIYKGTSIPSASFGNTGDLYTVYDDITFAYTQYIKALVDWEQVESGGISELEALDEGNGIGWRLFGRDPANFGNIGLNAVDLSTSISASTTRGATGNSSFTTGISNTASGIGSFVAGGGNNVASATDSFAQGAYTLASGNQSFSSGTYTIASGSSSYAQNGGRTSIDGFDITFGNTASGICSHAEGAGTLASAYTSHAEGTGTIALNEGSHASGKWNVGTAIDTILEVGIGTSDIARLNALEIYTDGTATLPNATNAEIDTRGIDAIATVGWVQTNAGGSALPIDGALEFENISSMAYNSTTNALETITYATGNISLFTYDVNDLLSTTEYTDIDGITVILTITYGYVNNNLTTVTRT